MARPNTSIVDLFSVDSPFATEFRRMLHRLRNMPDKQDLKIIMVTSSTLSEGKSTVCSFLAVTAARKGLKTLLVDCDLRRPTVHKLMSLPRDNGMSELLSGGLSPTSVIKKSGLEKLDIITAGRMDIHPEEIFDAHAIGTILTDLKFYYDLIMVDSPPVIPVSDPMLLAGEVDGVLLVVKIGVTQREIVKRAAEILDSDRKTLLGTVLNNQNQSLPTYYDSSHYGYDYSPKGKSQPSLGGNKSESAGISENRSSPASTGQRANNKRSASR